MKNLLYWVLCSSKGGPTRAKILGLLENGQYNANKIAEMLDMDYKTARHHLEIMVKHKLIVGGGEYGAVYSLTKPMQDNLQIFDEICNHLKKRGSDKIMIY